MRFWVALMLSLLIARAMANGISGGSTDGLSYGSMSYGGITFKKTTAVVPTCSGTIDLSTGCVLPMFGVQ